MRTNCSETTTVYYKCIQCGKILCGPDVICKECFHKFLEAKQYERVGRIDMKSMYPVRRRRR